jgi:hypothetical protein
LRGISESLEQAGDLGAAVAASLDHFASDLYPTLPDDSESSVTFLHLKDAFLAIGAGLAVGTLAEWLALSLVVALQLLTAPAGAHLVGRAAARAGIARNHLVVDELPRRGTRA